MLQTSNDAEYTMGAYFSPLYKWCQAPEINVSFDLTLVAAMTDPDLSNALDLI